MKALINLYRLEGKKEIPTVIADAQNDIYQLRIQIIDTTLIFRDSMKLFPISLNTIASNILGQDIQKISMNHEVIRHIFNFTDHKKILNI